MILVCLNIQYFYFSLFIYFYFMLNYFNIMYFIHHSLFADFINICRLFSCLSVAAISCFFYCINYNIGTYSVMWFYTYNPVDQVLSITIFLMLKICPVIT